MFDDQNIESMNLDGERRIDGQRAFRDQGLERIGLDLRSDFHALGQHVGVVGDQAEPFQLGGHCAGGEEPLKGRDSVDTIATRPTVQRCCFKKRPRGVRHYLWRMEVGEWCVMSGHLPPSAMCLLGSNVAVLSH